MFFFFTKPHLLLLAVSLTTASAASATSAMRGYDETQQEAILPSAASEEGGPRRVLEPIPPFREWSTSVDIYLDPDTSGGNNITDTRFDLTSSVNRLKNDDGTPALPCGARGLRDFIFSCGWYAATTVPTVAPRRWLCSESNNSPGDPKRGISNTPYTIPGPGWYTFRHTFKDVGGILSVDLEILNKSTGAVLKKWTLSTATDTIDKVEGSRNHWFVRLGCTSVNAADCPTSDSTFKLPIDNSKKCVKDFGCDFFQGFEVDTAGWNNTDGGLTERVSSGTGGITSSTGAYHALVSGTIPAPTVILPNPSATPVLGPRSQMSGRCRSYANDLCSGTADGAFVDASGCSDEDVDEDGDGVCNLDAASTGPGNLCEGKDLCPGTPPTTIVNEIGCSEEQKEIVCKSGKPGAKGKGKGQSPKAPGKSKKRF